EWRAQKLTCEVGSSRSLPQLSACKKLSTRAAQLEFDVKSLPPQDLSGSTPGCVYNNPDFRGIHGYSIDTAAAERPVPARPCQFHYHADGARHSDRRADRLLGGLGAGDLPGASAQRRWGAGTGACSGDLLLGALAACAQITCQMVAAAMGIPTEGIGVTVEGDLDLRGTLGLSKAVPIGFQSIRVIFDVRAPGATEEQLNALRAKTEQYCVVMQTLLVPPRIENKWE